MLGDPTVGIDLHRKIEGALARDLRGGGVGPRTAGRLHLRKNPAGHQTPKGPWYDNPVYNSPEWMGT